MRMHRPRCDVSKFRFLEAALDGYYEKSRENLPDELGRWVDRVFLLISWNNGASSFRRYVAQQWDIANNPANEEDNERLFKIVAELIPKWEACETPTALDIDKRDIRLAELNRELSTISDRLLARVSVAHTETNMANIEPHLIQRAAYSPEETCQLLGIGHTKFYQLVAEGRIKMLKLGRKSIVPAPEIPAFLNSLPAAKAA
jgi:excisionase family DNA binding protein